MTHLVPPQKVRVNLLINYFLQNMETFGEKGKVIEVMISKAPISVVRVIDAGRELLLMRCWDSSCNWFNF